MIRLFLPFFVWCERLFVGGLMVSLVVPLTIVAYFSDTETAKNQAFAATELRFATVPGWAEDAYLGVGLTPEATFTLPTELTEASTEAKLDIVATTEGDALFCAALRLRGDGYLGSVSGAASSFGTPTLVPGTPWDMTLRYETEEVLFTHGATCLVTVVAQAWQANMSKETAGYRDRYQYQVPVRAHLVVLNEVLARPNSGEPEFIELYNNSDLPIDVAGWNITEQTGTGNTVNHIITSNPISAGALIAYDGSLSTVVPPRGFLALKYTSGAYLNDSMDTLRLVDNAGYVIDQYSYVDAALGKSDARIPDRVGAWVDPVPTPNEPNILTIETPLEPEPEAAQFEVVLPTDPLENLVATDLETLPAVGTTTAPEEIILPNAETLGSTSTVEEVVDEVISEEAEILNETESPVPVEEAPLPSEPVLLETEESSETEVEEPEPELEPEPEPESQREADSITPDTYEETT